MANGTLMNALSIRDSRIEIVSQRGRITANEISTCLYIVFTIERKEKKT